MSDETTRKVGLFDLLNDISVDKKYLFDEDTATQYNAFMINRGLSQQNDTILLANEMNKRPGLSKEMQFDFLFYSVQARKRYGKWAKSDDSDKKNLDLIKEHYQVSNVKAIEMLKILDKRDLTYIKSLYEAGGKL